MKELQQRLHCTGKIGVGQCIVCVLTEVTQQWCRAGAWLAGEHQHYKLLGLHFWKLMTSNKAIFNKTLLLMIQIVTLQSRFSWCSTVQDVFLSNHNNQNQFNNQVSLIWSNQECMTTAELIIPWEPPSTSLHKQEKCTRQGHRTSVRRGQGESRHCGSRLPLGPDLPKDQT